MDSNRLIIMGPLMRAGANEVSHGLTQLGKLSLPSGEGVQDQNSAVIKKQASGGDSSGFLASSGSKRENLAWTPVCAQLFSEVAVLGVATEQESARQSQDIKLWPTGTDPFSHDYYQRLGVPRDAVLGAIKKAFHKLAQMLHPDTKSTAIPEIRELAESAFKNISEAYEVLGDGDKRMLYDRTGSTQTAGASEVDISADGLVMFEMALGFLRYKKTPGQSFGDYYQNYFRSAGCHIIFNYLVNSSFIRKRVADIYKGTHESSPLELDDRLRALLLYFIAYRSAFPEFKPLIMDALNRSDWGISSEFLSLQSHAINGVVMAFESDADYFSKLKGLLNYQVGHPVFERTKKHLLNRPITETNVIQAMEKLMDGDEIPRHARTVVLQALSAVLPEHPELAMRFIRWFDAAKTSPESVESAVYALAGNMASNGEIEEWFWSISRSERHAEVRDFANLMLAAHLGDRARSDGVVASLKRYSDVKGSETRSLSIRILDAWGEFDPKPYLETARNSYRPLPARQEAIEVLGLIIANSEIIKSLADLLDGYYEAKEIHEQIKRMFERSWRDPEIPDERRRGFKESLEWLSRKNYTDVGRWAAALLS